MNPSDMDEPEVERTETTSVDSAEASAAAEPSAVEPEPAVAAAPPWLADWQALAAAPIAGDDPAGEKLYDQADYEALDAEIRKPQAMRPEPVDWARVTEFARALLGGVSKDVKVAGYAAVAEVERAGARGQAIAGALLGGLAQAFGPGLWPRRKRARAGALEWAGERLVASVDGLRGDAATLALAADGARAAHESLTAAFAEDGLDELRLFRKWADALEAKRREAERAKAAPAAAAPTGGAPAAGGGFDASAITDPASARAAVTEARKALAKAAAVLRGADATDASAYRIARAAKWPDKLAFEVGADGRTPVPMLESAEVEAQLERFASERDEGVLGRIEAAFLERPFWLDLQRVLAQTMEAFGPRFDRARAAVEGATLDLVRRFPVLTTAEFANGVPFAGRATGAWITSLGGGSDEAPAASAETADDPSAAVEAAASAAAVRGDLRAALGAYQAGLASAADARTRFRLRLGLARTCLGQGQPAIALPHLVELRGDLDAVTLAEWAPDLAVDVLAATVQALREESKRLGGRPELVQRAEEALGELSRLDPLRALEFTS